MQTSSLFKFTTGKQNIFFTSDTHLGHNKPFIYEKRGYKNSEDHTWGVIGEINNTVGVDDILFHLGDFCLNTTEEQLNVYLSKINCNNILYVNGNHNNPLAALYKRELNNRGIAGSFFGGFEELYPLKVGKVTFIGPYREVLIDKQVAVLSHFPILSFNELKRGAWMLCGHSHGSCDLTKLSSKKGKYLDVGWDVHRKPLCFHDLKQIMDQKHLEIVDHHGVDSH